jgi:hypothetical protein
LGAKSEGRHRSVAGAGWAHAVGVALLLAAIALGLAAAAPRLLEHDAA